MECNASTDALCGLSFCVLSYLLEDKIVLQMGNIFSDFPQVKEKKVKNL